MDLFFDVIDVNLFGNFFVLVSERLDDLGAEQSPELCIQRKIRGKEETIFNSR